MYIEKQSDEYSKQLFSAIHQWDSIINKITEFEKCRSTEQSFLLKYIQLFFHFLDLCNIILLYRIHIYHHFDTNFQSPKRLIGMIDRRGAEKLIKKVSVSHLLPFTKDRCNQAIYWLASIQPDDSISYYSPHWLAHKPEVMQTCLGKQDGGVGKASMINMAVNESRGCHNW